MRVNVDLIRTSTAQAGPTTASGPQITDEPG